MKRIRIVGLCLVAAFGMSLAASSVASAAAPEFISKGPIGGMNPPVKVKQALNGVGAATLEGQVRAGPGLFLPRAGGA